MKTYNITVNGVTYVVNVEEVAGGAPVYAAPVAPAPAPAPTPMPSFEESFKRVEAEPVPVVEPAPVAEPITKATSYESIYGNTFSCITKNKRR